MLIMLNYVACIGLCFMHFSSLSRLVLFWQAGGFVVFPWWFCSPALTDLTFGIDFFCLVLYGWWLYTVSSILAMALLFCLRQVYENQWPCISFSLLLYYSSFSVSLKCSCGLVPGIIVMQVATAVFRDSFFSWVFVYAYSVCILCWQCVMFQCQQVFVLWWWNCTATLAYFLWLCFSDWAILYCWWLGFVIFWLAVAYSNGLRLHYDELWPLFPSFLLLPGSGLGLVNGYTGGSAPGGTMLNSVAPIYGEQPIPCTPRCWPWWPSWSMMIFIFPETFFSLYSLYISVMVPTFFLANSQLGFFHGRWAFTVKVDYLLIFPPRTDLCVLLSHWFFLSSGHCSDILSFLLMHLSWFNTGFYCCIRRKWTLSASYCLGCGLRLIQFLYLVNPSLGLVFYKLCLYIFVLSEFFSDIPFVLFYFCSFIWHLIFNCSMASEGEISSKALFQTAFGLSYCCFSPLLPVRCGCFSSQQGCDYITVEIFTVCFSMYINYEDY